MIHDRLFVECNYRKHWAVYQLWDSGNDTSAQEGKIPVLVLKEAHHKGELVVLDLRKGVTANDKNQRGEGPGPGQESL